jgi:hypothetical protein
MASEELRAEFKRMRAQKKTPQDFGLKVRAHPDSLIVTAQNKMRNANTVERVISISGESLETPRLKSNENVVRANKQTIERFFIALHDNGIVQHESGLRNPLWEAIPKRFVVSLLRGFDVHPLNISFQANDLASFLETTAEERLQTWDVVLPQGEGSAVDVAGITVRRNKRKVRVDENSVLVSGRSARVASRGIEREGMPADVIAMIGESYKRECPGKSVPDRLYREERTRPLLLVHLIEATTAGGGHLPPENLVALGLSFPCFNDIDVAKRVKYSVNLVEWNAIVQGEVDDDTDEELDDDES